MVGLFKIRYVKISVNITISFYISPYLISTKIEVTDVIYYLSYLVIVSKFYSKYLLVTNQNFHPNKDVIVVVDGRGQKENLNIKPKCDPGK